MIINKMKDKKHRSRLRQKFEDDLVKTLAKEFNVKNSLAQPRLVKVVINTGLGEISRNKEFKSEAIRDLSLITGQKPGIRTARVSIASFNLRAGMPVGLKVTLRGDKMYDFLDKLFSITLPRLRDFRGVSPKGFDREGNYTLGIVEHTVFPEINLAKTTHPFGLEITIVTNTKNITEAKRLLGLLGMPLEKGKG